MPSAVRWGRFSRPWRRWPRARWWRWGAGILLAAGLVWVGNFVHTAEVRLGQIPGMVRADLAERGSRFVPLKDIPSSLIAASVAVEDRSFWTNPGISPEGIARAAVVDLVHDRFAQGGSTITQQLVRDMLLGFQKTLGRKLTEVAYSLLCADRYSKDEVMALYLNEVNYGNGAFGIAAAAKTYFHLQPSALSLPQCALLAGIPQDPGALNPLRHPHAAHARQLVVLQAMVKIGAISPALARATAQAPLGLLPSP